MSFRGRGGDAVGNPNKMDLGEPRKFGGPDNDKSNRDDADRFDSSRGRSGRPPFGRGGRPSPARDKPFNDRSRDYGYGRDEPPIMRDRSPLHGPDDRFSDRFRKDDSFSKRADDHGRKDSGRPFYGDDSPRDRFMDRSRHEGGPGNFSSRFDPPPSSMPFKSGGRPMGYPSSGSKYFNEGFPKPNECEIIVVNKQQRAYAESVEDRVKSIGILVDILFLKDEALLTQTIDDIARRGCLYAMVISPQNETHGSVTVNILHGTPQEHRNMPLEDALKLLSRNFHEHIRSQREHMDRERAERGQYIGVVADREIQFLLRMLADGRWISLTEINVVIRYLIERRDKMQGQSGDDRVPGRMPVPPGDVKIDPPPFKPKDDVVDVQQKEQDLQNRIINLMNQGAPSSAGGTLPGLGVSDMDMPPLRQNQPNMSPNMGGLRPPLGIGSGAKPGRPGLDENLPGPQGLNTGASSKDPVNKPAFSNTSMPTDSPATPTYINFDNPSVQKALDNLMQSGPNLLKNISLSASSVTNTPSNQPPSAAASDTAGMNAPNDLMMPRGNMGPRGSDMGGNQPPRNVGNLDMGPRGGHMSDMGGAGGLRNSPSMPGMGGMGPGRGGGYGGNMPDMGNMNNPRGFGGGGGMPDMGRMGPPRGGMGPPQGQDRGLPQGMGQGGNFSNQNQFNKFQGPGQQGNFPGPYNTPPGPGGMGGMSRQGYGGPQGMGGMGGGPRRY